jgi:hypothetical protein
MTKVLAVGLGLVLSTGVVHAQAKKAPKKAAKPPASTPAPAAPATTPAPDPATPDVITDARPGQPDAVSSSYVAPSNDPAKPNKTDEKAGTNESLEKTSTNPWVAGVTPEEQQAALRLFREGNSQLNDGLFVSAVNKYRDALKHWNHPAIHYNLSLALLNLDQPIEVYDELNKALQYGAAPLEKDKYDHAKEYLLLVEKQLADVEVSCDKIGAKVSVDGKEVFIAPGKFSQKVRVGKHTFYADKQGYNARITAPYIGPGEKFRIELKLYTAEELTRYRRKWDNTWFPYVVVGAGALVAGGGALFEHLAQSDYDKYNAKVGACNTSSAGCSIKTPGIQSLHDSGDTKRTIGFIGYGVGAAAAVTGAVLLYVNRREPYQISAEQLNATPGGVAVAPLVSPDAVGASVMGHF